MGIYSTSPDGTQNVCVWFVDRLLSSRTGVDGKSRFYNPKTVISCSHHNRRPHTVFYPSWCLLLSWLVVDILNANVYRSIRIGEIFSFDRKSVDRAKKYFSFWIFFLPKLQTNRAFSSFSHIHGRSHLYCTFKKAMASAPQFVMIKVSFVSLFPQRNHTRNRAAESQQKVKFTRSKKISNILDHNYSFHLLLNPAAKPAHEPLPPPFRTPPERVKFSHLNLLQ